MLYKTCTNFVLPFLQEKHLLSTTTHDIFLLSFIFCNEKKQLRATVSKQAACRLHETPVVMLPGEPYNNIKIYNDISWCVVKAIYSILGKSP